MKGRPRGLSVRRFCTDHTRCSSAQMLHRMGDTY